MSELIVVCVCTRNRPNMLARCLRSIGPHRQHTVGGVDVRYVVVDNAPSPRVWRVVKTSLPGAEYVEEPRIGLSYARNAAVARALELGADWIAFIDDDEEAADDWLFNLYWSARRYEADAVLGVVRYRFPAGAPAWRRRNPWGDWADHDGAELNSAGTGNVLFRTNIVRRARLTFSAARNLAGGEDGQFFGTYHDLGGKIVFSSAPRVIENVPWSRITVRGFARKAHRNGAQKVESARIMGRYKPRRFVRKAVSRMLTGVGLTMLAPFAVLAGRGLQVLSSGVDDFAEAAGMVRGMLGIFPNYYATTDGH
jgi:succinoglycan biosynthesis protein ExoM